MFNNSQAKLIGSYLTRIHWWLIDWLEKTFYVITILVDFTIIYEILNLKYNQVMIIEILFSLVLVCTE